MKTILRVFTAVSTLIFTATAQTPYTLKHSIAPPPGVQQGEGFGSSVVTSGGFTAVGAPRHSFPGEDVGIVKVFDSATGAVRFFIESPSGDDDEYFGGSMVMSGTRLAVGAYYSQVIYVFDLASATPTVPVATLHSPQAGSRYFGSALAMDGTRVVVSNPYGYPQYSGPSEVYVFDIATPNAPVATFAQVTGGDDQPFGSALAISGNRVVVGDWGYDGSFYTTTLRDLGRAYVYDLASATPTTPALSIEYPGANSQDAHFARSLALSGNRLLISSPHDNGAGADSGAVWEYNLGSSTPTVPVSTIHKPSGEAGDSFGWAMALSGSRAVIAPMSYIYGTVPVKAFVFDLASATPTVPTTTFSCPVSENLSFAQAFSISGTKVVIGNPSEDFLLPDAGRAYLYDLPSTTPTALDGGTTNKPFGTTVAVSGTLMAVGIYDDADDSSFFGALNVYDLSSATPTVPVLEINNPGTGDDFGRAVAISGTRVVVNGRGSAYVYDLSSATPAIPVATLNYPGPANWGYFGDSVAISGTRVVVGDHGYGTVGGGSAYVYDLSSGTPTVPVVTLNNPSGSNDAFGYSVAIDGTRVAVGAQNGLVGSVTAGRVHVYDLSSGTPTSPVATLNNPDPANEDYFGRSVAISGARVIVGAFGDDTGTMTPGGYHVIVGSAYAYDLSSGTPSVPIATLRNPDPVNQYGFGYSVAISGSRAVVGALYSDNGLSTAGSAYVYDLASATPTVSVAKLENLGPVTDEVSGFSVAIDGSTIALGVPYDDAYEADKKYAYVFGPADDVAQPPTLTAPVANTLYGNDIVGSYTLPEDASDVGLHFSDSASGYAATFVAVPGGRSAGVHSFVFRPFHQNGPGFEPGTPVPDGTYSVTLWYRDLAGDLAATPAITGVVMDTTPPTMGSITLNPSEPIFAGVPFTMTATGFTDIHGPLEYSFPLSDGNSGEWQSSNVSAPITLPTGFRQLTGRVRDSLGNQVYFFRALTVEPQVGPQVHFATGDAVPQAGNDPRIDASAQWVSFGSPAIADFGANGPTMTYRANWKSLAGPDVGIFRDQQLLVKVGEPVQGIPDATWRSFKDPVCSRIEAGTVAFIGTIHGAGVTSLNNTVVAYCDGPYSVTVLVREGGEAPDSGGAVFRDFSSVSASDSGIYMEATLLAGSGSPAVVTATDRGVWRYRADFGTQKLFREGDSSLTGMVAGETLRSFAFLSATPGSPGHGRGTHARTSARWLLSSGRTLSVTSGSDDEFALQAATGTSLNSTLLPGARWTKSGQILMGYSHSVLGEMTPGIGGVTAANAKGIFLSNRSSPAWEPVARTSDTAPGMGSGAVFKAFKDPVSDILCAFMATATGGSVTTADNEGIWGNDRVTGALGLIAREGGQPPGAPAGAQWKAFTSLAYSGGGADTSYHTPLFTATLRVGPGGITNANDFALYAFGTDGLRELLREGQALGGRTVRSFDILETTSGSIGVTRSFNTTGFVAARVTFTDNSNAIVTIPLH